MRIPSTLREAEASVIEQVIPLGSKNIYVYSDLDIYSYLNMTMVEGTRDSDPTKFTISITPINGMSN